MSNRLYSRHEFGEKEEIKRAKAATGDKRPIVATAHAKDDYDFYRCKDCHRLITLVEERLNTPKGIVCKCGCMRYVPSWPNGWSEWLSPRVAVFAILRLLNRPLARNNSEDKPAPPEVKL